MIEKIKQFLSKAFLSKYLGSWVRTAFAALGGLLVAKGITPDDSSVQALIQPTTEILLGVLSWAIAQGTSIAQKKLEEKK